jgi:4'-phosphopantetheinyl transferase EntD
MRIEDAGPTGTRVALAVASEPRGRGSARSAERRASDVAAARALDQLLGGDAHAVVLRRAGRPPRVRDVGRLAPVLSLTHAGGRAAAIAAPAGARVGIDLEREDAVHPDHARYFLTPRERVARTLPLSSLWALKEAAWKALALGADVAFQSLELDVSERGTLRAVRFDGRRLRAAATLSSPWPGWVLATVRVEDAC